MVIWGGFPKRGAKALVHRVTFVLLGARMVMPGVVAAMLGHEDKGGRDGPTRS